MLCSFSLLLFYPSFHTVASGMRVTHMSHLCSPNLPQLCACGHWSTTGPQLKPRDKNIIAVSAGRKRIRLLQIGPFRILPTKKRVKPMQFQTRRWRRIFSEGVGRERLRFTLQINTALLEATTDKNRRELQCNSHCICACRQFINDIPQMSVAHSKAQHFISCCLESSFQPRRKVVGAR